MGLFERPVGLDIDSEDRIIITDSTRGRLQIYAKEKDYMDPSSTCRRRTVNLEDKKGSSDKTDCPYP